VSAPRRAGHPGGGGEGGAQTLKAVLVIVVVILIGVAVLHRSGKPVAASSSSTVPPTTAHGATQPNHPATATTTTVPAPTTTTTLVPVSSVKLTVLNGTGISGVAKKWSDKLRASPGYDTLAPDNATKNVTASEIYVITPGYEATAVNPTVPAPASAPIPAGDRQAANLVLVIGPDLAAKA
jgi:LytR cell envelope-related transcriptional attenuator